MWDPEMLARLKALDLSRFEKKVVAKRPRGEVQHPTKNCKAILKLLRDEGYDLDGPDENWRIVPTRAGHWQRSEGAWSWALEWRGEDRPACGYVSYGSQFPASECAKPGATIETTRGDVVIYPPNCK